VVERDGEAKGSQGPTSVPPPPAHRLPKAPTIISLLGSSASHEGLPVVRASEWRGWGRGLEGFIIFTRRYRSNPTILIPRRGAIAHLKERPATDPRLLAFIRYRRAHGALILSALPRALGSKTFYFRPSLRFNAIRRMRSNRRTFLLPPLPSSA